MIKAVFTQLSGLTSLSSNNNGFNGYFLFNDLRNGHTTIHSWDMVDTTERQKDICLLMLRNRRKKDFGPIDGNPLSLAQFQILDESIDGRELEEMVSLGILKKKKCAYSITNDIGDNLSETERFILAKCRGNLIVPDELVCDREIKIRKVNVSETLQKVRNKGTCRVY